MTATCRHRRRKPWIALLLLPVWLGVAAPRGTAEPPDADLARAIQIHVLLALRSAPQLRLFRNDFKERGTTLAVRLVGTPSRPFAAAGAAESWASSRNAIGARVTVETEQFRRMKTVDAGSGFLSQHSKELLFGLGASQQVVQLTVEWPSGRPQVFTDVPLNHRLRIEEGGEPRPEPYRALPALAADVVPPEPASPPSATWLFEPFPAPDFSIPDLRGEERSLSALRGRPAVVLLWAADATPSRTALLALAGGGDALAQAGIGAVAIALNAPENLPEVRAAASGVTTVPVLVASEQVALGYAILNRHLFMNPRVRGGMERWRGREPREERVA